MAINYGAKLFETESTAKSHTPAITSAVKACWQASGWGWGPAQALSSSAAAIEPSKARAFIGEAAEKKGAGAMVREGTTASCPPGLGGPGNAQQLVAARVAHACRGLRPARRPCGSARAWGPTRRRGSPGHQPAHATRTAAARASWAWQRNRPASSGSRPA